MNYGGLSLKNWAQNGQSGNPSATLSRCLYLMMLDLTKSYIIIYNILFYLSLAVGHNKLLFVTPSDLYIAHIGR